MNVLSREKQIEVIAALCEGVGIRTASRLTGVNRGTVGSLYMSRGDISEFADTSTPNFIRQRQLFEILLIAMLTRNKIECNGRQEDEPCEDL